MFLKCLKIDSCDYFQVLGLGKIFFKMFDGAPTFGTNRPPFVGN